MWKGDWREGRTSSLTGIQPSRWLTRTSAATHSVVFQPPVRWSPLTWPTRTEVVLSPVCFAARPKSCSVTHLLSLYPIPYAMLGSTSSVSAAGVEYAWSKDKA